MLELEFKPDCGRACQMWQVFWNGDDLPRPLVSIIIPKNDVKPIPKPIAMACLNEDVDKVIERVIAWVASHDFIGEAIPSFSVHVGCIMSAMLGAKQVVHPDSPDTVWAVPCLEDWDKFEIKFNPDESYFKMTIDLIRRFRQQCDDRLLIVRPTLISGLDILAALRGTEKLLMDLVMIPDKVKKALDDVDVAYKKTLDMLLKEQGVDIFGDITRHQMYHPGSIGVPQSDISCMISPQMYEEFVTPWLKKELNPLDAATYHLDGPGAVQHLEAICEINGVDSIQWQPGAGEAMTQDWTELYKQIDSFGKKQVLGGGGVLVEDHEYIKKLCQELNWKNLFFVTTATSKSEAESFLHELEKICKG